MRLTWEAIVKQCLYPTGLQVLILCIAWACNYQDSLSLGRFF
jgi:hypothetical protein